MSHQRTPKPFHLPARSDAATSRVPMTTRDATGALARSFHSNCQAESRKAAAVPPMFQTKPSSRQQRRPRRLPSGTMVSYAEVKSYLSKREIPQLFESLMAGLMYHRPENHIGYLQTCLDEVKTNGEGKVHWNTFVNTKKRKSKEILPPLTPKKQQQASYSSSLSDNSRQSTPLPPISAKTRTRTSHDDLRNTYILYHNPPPVLAKPKVPVVSVLGGLGSNIDELCERVVGRLRGVVHISTCSMLKTRMTIEGFYRITSVPACAVVDSVLQAMSMVQSANGLIVAGFPRNRGDIEEYRSRRVRMDGVVLVDFEEEALRRFLESEVSGGALRLGDVESELERYKQDIISVAEYYDEKELLTVVMGDQDMEEIIDDLVLAVDKVIETRKNVNEEDSLAENKKTYDGPCKTLMASPECINRPSTVEIRDATEEDLKSLEKESSVSEKSNEKDIDNKLPPLVDMNKNEKEDVVNISSTQNDDNSMITDDVAKEVPLSLPHLEPDPDELPPNASQTDIQKSEVDYISENVMSASEPHMDYKNVSSEDKNTEISSEENKSDVTDQQSLKLSKPQKEYLEEVTKEKIEVQSSSVPLFFAFENIEVDYEKIKNLVVNEMGMCFIDFQELVRNDGSQNDQFDTDDALKLLHAVLQHDPVSYSNGFFISKFPFLLMSDHRITELLKLGDVNFVCKVRENKSQSDSKSEDEERLFHSNLNGRVRILFITECNIVEELKVALHQVVSSTELHDSSAVGSPKDYEKSRSDNKNTKHEVEDDGVSKTFDEEELEHKSLVHTENGISNADANVSKDLQVLQAKSDANELNPVLPDGDELTKDSKNSRDDNEDSTSRDVDDLISDNTLEEALKPSDSLVSEADKDAADNVGESDALSLASTAESIIEDTQRENDQQKLEDVIQDASGGVEKDEEKPESERIYGDPPSSSQGRLLRQSTFCADDEAGEKIDDQNQIKAYAADNFENKEDLEGPQENDRTESSVPEAENQEDVADENGSECNITASDPESQINDVEHQEAQEEIKHSSDKSSDTSEKVENATNDLTDFATTVVKYVETVKKLESVCDESVNDTESSSAECKDVKSESEEEKEKEGEVLNSAEGNDEAKSNVEMISSETTDFASTVIKYVETVKKSESVSEVSEQDVECTSNENNAEISKSDNEEIGENGPSDKSGNINSEESKDIEYSIKDITDFATTVIKYVETMKQPSISSEESEEDLNNIDENVSQKQSTHSNEKVDLPKIDETASEIQVLEATAEEEVKVVNIEILEIVRDKSPVIPMETIDEELGEHDLLMDQNETIGTETEENKDAEIDEDSVKNPEENGEELSLKNKPDDENSENLELSRLSETNDEIDRDTEICEDKNTTDAEERETSTADNKEEENTNVAADDESSKIEPENTETKAENETDSIKEEQKNDNLNGENQSNHSTITNDQKSEQEQALDNVEDNKNDEKEDSQKATSGEKNEDETKADTDQSELESRQEHPEDTEQDMLKSDSKSDENNSAENNLNISSTEKHNEEKKDENAEKETTTTDENIDETESQSHSNESEEENKATSDEENCNDSTNESQVFSEEVMHKIVENDSDSNDGDHTVTIETQAEVHAPDSVSPLITADHAGEKQSDEPAEAEDEKSATEEAKSEEKNSIGDENTTEESKSEEKNYEEDEKSNPAKSQNEEGSPGEDQKSSTEESKSEEEKNPEENEKDAIGESKNEEKNSEDCPAVEDVPSKEEVHEENVTENTDLSEGLLGKDIDESLGSERYSAKIQERNGSGILGDREDDQQEPEEPQERSSSSSRGEL